MDGQVFYNWGNYVNETLRGGIKHTPNLPSCNLSAVNPFNEGFGLSGVHRSTFRRLGHVVSDGPRLLGWFSDPPPARGLQSSLLPQPP